MINRLLFRVALFVSRWPKWVIIGVLAAIVVTPFAGIIGAKIYQRWDNDPKRGAIAITDGAFGESYTVPEYLDQGWDAADSLWYYNTTQGSALLPYDFFLVLEQPGLKKVECERNEEKAAWFLCDHNVDRFRYLPQKKTFFNPDALPVGFARETYQGRDYVGYTCAACHTAQINFRNPGEQTARALRIDGGPAMADMVGFLTELTRSMKLTRGLPGRKNPRLDRFIERVLALNNDYDTADEITEDLEKWTNARLLYNIVNDPTYSTKDPRTNIRTRHKLEYGYARLDAFGRIYNRVIQHAINKEQVKTELSLVTNDDGTPLLTKAQIDKVVEGVGKPDDIVLRDDEFWKIISNLDSKESGFPGLNYEQFLLVRKQIFNPPNAPVSYPFLWDIAHSDYVQWNGLASNAALGPLGRNAGEVTGVFAIIDWQEDKRWLTSLTGFSLSALASGQNKKKKQIYFKSSIDLFNLQRLESQLGNLESPRWPFCRDGSGGYYLPVEPAAAPGDEGGCNPGDGWFDEESRERGRLIYANKCQGCHDVIERDAWDRLMVSNMTGIRKAGTDKAMAENSVKYTGKSGNFKDTYQTVDVGKVVVHEDAPVAQLLTTAVTGVVATSDADKWWPRRGTEFVYALGVTFFENQIKASVKVGNYDPDTTAEPYRSLLSYRARSLNGIWATAPYLHNGSVPSLYELLLPVKCKEGVGDGKYRPGKFIVGAREFDPVKVGFKSEGYDGFAFDTAIPGNANTGHEYGACRMTDSDRMDLIEYLKSL